MKRLILLAALIAGPADAQRMAREDVLAQRMFSLDLMTICPNEIGTIRLRSLIDRTKEAILRTAPGARGEGILAGINSGLIVARSSILFSGHTDDVCHGMNGIFTEAVGQAARE